MDNEHESVCTQLTKLTDNARNSIYILQFYFDEMPDRKSIK